ncbi:hypothetical protein Ciccas_012848, partial [Cichlidogyrus casuarinus]
DTTLLLVRLVAGNSRREPDEVHLSSHIILTNNLPIPVKLYFQCQSAVDAKYRWSALLNS